MGNQQTCCLEGQDYDERQKSQIIINPIKYGKKISVGHHYDTNQNNKNVNNQIGNNDKNVFTGKQHQEDLEKSRSSKVSQRISKKDFTFEKQTAKIGNSKLNQSGKIVRNIPQTNQFKLNSSKAESQINILHNGVTLSQKAYLNQRDEYNFSDHIIKTSQDSKRNRQSNHYTDFADMRKRQSIGSSIKRTSYNQRTEQYVEMPPSKQLFREEQIIIDYLPIVSRLIAREKPFQEEFYSIKDHAKKLKLNGDKDIYKGQLNEFKQPHGYGILVKQNGSVLLGKFNKGIIQGEAMFIFNNGSYYKGNMINNKAHAKNGQFHSKKLTYFGGFQNNQFQGECQELGEDYYFKGFYQNNQRKYGTLHWGMKKQSKIRNSRALSGRKSSQTSKYGQNDLQLPPFRDFDNLPQFNYTYEGNFNDNQQFIGIGTLKQRQGVYSGNFQNGFKQGKGYVGQYDKDLKSGYGILYNCDNTIAYEGNWSNGMPNGKGFSFDLKGRRTQAQFINGINSKIIPPQQQQYLRNSSYNQQRPQISPFVPVNSKISQEQSYHSGYNRR